MAVSNKTLSILFAVFLVSGFSGLIYESIWTQYLKLFLGHASYAQVLVLTIFMGGMAIGAALAARWGLASNNLIMWYGAIEATIGVLALLFHDVFVVTQSFTFDTLLPLVDSPPLITATKWLVGAVIILPQSILLGATFPVLATGVIRKYATNTGRSLSTLYFVNSLGAAIGVLVNSFVLVPKLGLPGAVLTAGIINILLAIVVYRMAKHDHHPLPPASSALSDRQATDSQWLVRVFLLVAVVTGCASFMYEIAWIRLLTMVLGGSTHSFEIMLSSFILGLAIGGFWIRNKIDGLQNPVLTLGFIQVTMGVLAALTIPLYNQTYELMGYFFNALEKTDEGYLLYNVFNYGISLLVMLPATICAGTTLPLVTHTLLKRSSNDSAIGSVYAANTVGSILGVVVAIQVLMPVFGLKVLVLTGAALDIVLGLGLILLFSHRVDIKRGHYALGAALLAALLFLPVSSSLDTAKMASGVFRYGLRHVEQTSVLFHKDGKTSTVAVKGDGDVRVLLNNGKPDAAVFVGDVRGKAAGDESTMILLGSLPYLYRPDAKLIANVGLGSGMTAHTLLQNPQLERLDTIEIEAAVVEAAQFFGDRVSKVFTDPRSNIVIDDAKTFFASQGVKYDVIVSEPPNPWVSGVAGLFSEEFYEHLQRYIARDGVVVQWLHIYEITPALVATVYNAMGGQFRFISMYQIGAGDIAFVASNRPLKTDSRVLFADGPLQESLHLIKVRQPNDLLFRKLGENDFLKALFTNISSVKNSDYFPVLDVGAAEARYKNLNAHQLYDFRKYDVVKRVFQVENNLYADADPITVDPVNMNDSQHYDNSRIFAEVFAGKHDDTALDMGSYQVHENASRFKNSVSDCEGAQYSPELRSDIVVRGLFWATDFLSPFTQKNMLTMATLNHCAGTLDDRTRAYIGVSAAWMDGDYGGVINRAGPFLAGKDSIKNIFDGQLLKYFLASLVLLNRGDIDVKSIKGKTDQTLMADLELITLFSLTESIPVNSNR